MFTWDLKHGLGDGTDETKYLPNKNDEKPSTELKTETKAWNILETDTKFCVPKDEEKESKFQVKQQSSMKYKKHRSSSPEIPLHFGKFKADPDKNDTAALRYLNSTRPFEQLDSWDAGTAEIEPPFQDTLEDLENVPLRRGMRQRTLMDAVVLPKLTYRPKTIISTEVIDLEKKEIEEKLEKLKNPKVKKMEGLMLSVDTVKARLKDIGFDPYPIPLDKSITDVTVSRQFISHLYGGNTQETCPKIRKEMVDKHGLNDFMFPNLLYNPHAPEVPGAPGLFFSVVSAELSEVVTVYRVITRLSSGIWQYQGQYEMKRTKSLTREEWLSQDAKVRRTWGLQICTKGWGRVVRARISLRKTLGREATLKELQEALKTTNQFTNITPEEVIAAFNRGEQVLGACTMQCVGYDVEFQKNLVEKLATWEPPAKTKARTSKKTPKASTQGRKRKHNDSDSDSGDAPPSNDARDEESDVAVIETVYHPSGTRSRPIIL